MPKPEGPQFFGRRKGRPLRNQLKTLMQTKLSEVRFPEPKPGPIDISGLFPHMPKDIYLEIGFGGGEHLASLASSQPEAGFIGAEPFVNGVASLLRHIEARGIENIRIWPDDVRLILPSMADGCLAGAYVMFPDPWPKRRHASRRILNQTMLLFCF